MKESFKKAHKEEPKKMNRRGFLGLFSGALTSAAIGGPVVLQALRKEESEQSNVGYDKDDLNELINEEEEIKSFEGISNSKFFITQIVAESDRYDRELPVVLEYAQAITAKDPEGRSRMEYLHEMLDAEGVPDAAMVEIKKQIVGLGFEESRYDAERESGEKARGILQIIPSTWDDLSTEGESVLSLVDQTRVAGELLSQTYEHLQNTVKDELQAIEAEFFHGDSEEFEKCFLAPVLINAYNAGMGNMAKLIGWFARTYGTQEKTIGLFGQDQKLSGYDVFTAMAKQGLVDEPVGGYKKDASAYTFKVYGAALCLLRHPASKEIAA